LTSTTTSVASEREPVFSMETLKVKEVQEEPPPLMTTLKLASENLVAV
jgi:hypothetical protein